MYLKKTQGFGLNGRKWQPFEYWLFYASKAPFLMYVGKSGQSMQQISNFDHLKLSRVNEELNHGLNSY